MKPIALYLLVCAVGTGIILLIMTISGHPSVREGEYYYSESLRYGYNVMTACLFFLTGVAAGLYTRLNPWLTGLCLVMIFPVVAIYEATKYRGSHNLIPFELIIYFVYALPAIAGVFIGRLIYNKRVLKARQQ